jgi:hypothetical protein
MDGDTVAEQWLNHMPAVRVTIDSLTITRLSTALR